MKKLPTLSHLQVRVLECLGSNRLAGRELRQQLASRGTKKSGPAFYQLMARLEDSELVKGEYTHKLIENQPIKERYYTVTAKGCRALQETLNFYEPVIRSWGIPAIA